MERRLACFELLYYIPTNPETPETPETPVFVFRPAESNPSRLHPHVVYWPRQQDLGFAVHSNMTIQGRWRDTINCSHLNLNPEAQALNPKPKTHNATL